MFSAICCLILSVSISRADNDYEIHYGVYPEREVKGVAPTESPYGPDIDCAGMHYEFMQHKNVNVAKFRSRWNFHADSVAGCAQACNQVINFDCKTFIFKHFFPGSINGTCMLSSESERDLEPVKICFGPYCKNDLYHRIGCIPIACDKSQCPDVPSSFCHTGEEIRHHTTSKDSCCPLFAECVCKEQKCAPLPPEPSGTGVVSFSKSLGCCPKWEVHCNASACASDLELSKTDCQEAGEIITLQQGVCCKEAKCVCKESSCPLPARCEDNEELQIFPGKCCNISRCKPRAKSRAGPAVIAPAPLSLRNGTDIYPLCGENGKHGNIDPVWCEVLLRVDESEHHAYLLFGLVTAFFMLVLIAACCAIVLMTITLMKVGKNKLA